MHREDLLKHWNDAWTNGLWAAPWSKAIDDLTPAQAAWTPAPGRHSIWQIVNHMIFWREHDLALLKAQKMSSEEKERRNFEPTPSPASDAAWRETKKRFAQTHQQIDEAIANPANSIERLQYFLFHDSYHFGQIMYLRGMQGLKPIE
jgi:uncharacterized damage-inducible protein DinB